MIISLLPAGTTPTGIESIPAAQGGQTVRLTAAQIAGYGYATGIAAWLAAPSSANLRAAMTDETGTGSAVFATSPTLVTPLLGTPTSGILTNCTGLPVGSGIAGLGTGVATFLGTPSSANLLAAVTDETGTGALVFGTSPTFTTSVSISSASIGMLDVQKTSFSQIDGASWAESWTRIGANFSAAGSGSNGSANEIGLGIQVNVAATTSSAASYEKVAALFIGRSVDPSTALILRDVAGCDMRGYIANSNTGGRAWGAVSWAEIQSGGTGEGYLVGHEIDVVNNGADQATVDTATTKCGLQVIAFGSADSTVAMQARTGGAKWHKVLFSSPADISTSGNFLELFGVFTVDKSGNVVANAVSSSVIVTTPTVVGSLPAAAAGNKGWHMYVTDSNAASFTAGIGAVVAAGGALNVPVVSDGTNWRIG